ncbi:MAG: hypothetical protein PHC29_03360 [Candidatus Omnitrophica bacterium]|nr:hypothetical protein [Candidatus Omnitrophota bacterium]
MRKLNTKEKLLSICIGLLLGLFVIKTFVLGPIYEKTAVFTEEIEQSKMAIRKYVALEANRTEILKAQKQIEGYSSLRGSDEEQSAMVMSKVEAEARKSKLQILDMNFVGSSKVKGGVVNLYSVSLRAEGQLKNVLDFISGIEGANILLQVEKITLSAKDDMGTILKIDATISGVSFS